MVRRLLADTNVFLYATGSDHPLREPCRAIVEAAGEGRFHLTISAEVLQEFAHVRRRRGVRGDEVANEVGQLGDLCEVVPLNREVMEEVAALFSSGHDRLSVRDLVMVATAARAELAEILTADHGFDRVASAARVAPEALAEELLDI